MIHPRAVSVSPTTRRAVVTVCAMTATIMQALDTTIANVALPYMQGSLNASLDQINWVLTSYIVAAAIMTAPVGWLSDRFGRKKLFILCAAGFTFASLLCALAHNIEQIVVFRLLQGMFGAALVPLSQSVMLDAYPVEQRGSAMAIWGIGVMLGPIMGPTLGGWLTDNYSWHWVFLVNLPVGAITVVGLLIFMQETKQQLHLRFDWFGFLALSIGIGSLQLMLDRGEQVGWFDSGEIILECVIGVAGFYYFLAHSLTTASPFVRFELFKDRNYLLGCVFMVVIGVSIFAIMALVTPFMQNIMGYPIVTAGLLLASRGVGTLTALIFVGRLLKLFEPRTLIFGGMILTIGTIRHMAGFTNDTSSNTIIVTSLIQGFGLGLIFVPVNMVAFATLPAHLRTDGTAIFTLVRNIASAVGISIVIANLTRMTTANHARLVEYVTPFNDALKNADIANKLDLATDTGRAMMDQIVTQQAALIAYANDFTLLMWIVIAATPFVFLIGPLRAKLAAQTKGEPVHALD